MQSMSKDDLRDACVPVAARLHLIKAFRGFDDVARGDAGKEKEKVAGGGGGVTLSGEGVIAIGRKEEENEENAEATRTKHLTTMSIKEMKVV